MTRSSLKVRLGLMILLAFGLTGFLVAWKPVSIRVPRAPRGKSGQPGTPTSAPVAGDHGWGLLVQITGGLNPSKDDFPPYGVGSVIWKGKCDPSLMLSAQCPVTDSPSNNEVKQITPGRSPQIDPDRGLGLKLSSVYYNDIATDWIIQNHLNSVGTGLHSLIDSRTTNVPGASSNTIVVKAIWEAPLVESGNEEDGTAVLSTIPLFNPSVLPQADGTLHAVRQWKPLYQLVSNVPCPDIDFPAQQSLKVPLNCFYHRYLPNCLGVIAGNIEEPVNGQTPTNTPCFLVLVGVSIAQKEGQIWTWTTFWWSTKAIADGDDAQKKFRSKLLPEYRHFLMSTTYQGGAPQNPDCPRAVFNPYLDGVNGAGTRSNCIHCHIQAVYIPLIPQPCPPGGTCGHGSEVVRNGDVDAIHAIINNDGSPGSAISTRNTRPEVYTDSLWSISSSQSPK